MKQIKLILAVSLIIVVLCGCTATVNLLESDDYGDAGVYDLEGNLLISYKALVRNYGFDVSKDYENGENKGFAGILQELDIHEDIRFVVPNVSKIGEYALSYADNLAYCELPDTLETICSYAFYASGLQEITLHSAVLAIGNNAFDSCGELSKVTLNDGLKVIETSAFRYTPKLTEITIPQTVETIGACAFQDTGISYVRIPDTVSTIEDYAFENVDTVCYNGTDQTGTGFGATYFHQFSGSNTCELCGATMEYVPYTIKEAEFIDHGICDIPESFERDGVQYVTFAIAIGAYKDNADMTGLKIPDSIKDIQDEAFANCSRLEQVVLNENLENMGNYVFSNCASIEEIVIPDQVSSINGCFKGCTGLKKITLPNKISMDTETFQGCENLASVYYAGTEEEWRNISVGAPAPIMETTTDKIFDERVTIIFK